MRSLKSELNDRKLRFDGVSEVDPGQLSRFLLLGVPSSKLRVSEVTSEVETFNQQVDEKDQIQSAQDEAVSLDMSWQLPAKYMNLDLHNHMAHVFFKRLDSLEYDDETKEKAADRIAEELNEIESRGMAQFMRTIIYVLDELKRNNVVWGVGRGSSCASYLLFLIGLHVVDCVTMDVSLEEFFHD